MQVPKVTLWMGQRVEELDKTKLLDVVAHCMAEIEALRTDRDRWKAAGDTIKYLLNGSNLGRD